MKRFTSIALFSLLALLAIQTHAQNLIAVQNGNTPKFYLQVDDAITNSVDGDTIYIPGGSFPINTYINKRIHLIGVGHNSDFTIATNFTLLTGQVYISQGASGGSLLGLFLNGGISFGTTDANETVTNYSVSRCNFGGLSSSIHSANCIFKENVIKGGISIDYAFNFLFSNNIIEGSLSSIGGNNLIFKNNLFLFVTNGVYYSGFTRVIQNISFSLFENNVFNSPGADNYSNWISPIGGAYNCTIRNNLLVNEPAFPVNSNNIFSNNVIINNGNNLFVNQTGSTFSYSQDYHLKPESLGKIAGRDGTDIGIYGGDYPWKEGSIPINPHFESLQIGSKTDNSGNLIVKIKVAAQDH